MASAYLTVTLEDHLSDKVQMLPDIAGKLVGSRIGVTILNCDGADMMGACTNCVIVAVEVVTVLLTAVGPTLVVPTV